MLGSLLPALAIALQVHDGVIVDKNVEARMRDGVVLRSDVYRPDAPGRYPALLKRTPYSKAAPSEIALFHRLARQGFVVAVQDTRGRYTSDGVARPHDEADDGYDTLAWLAGLPYVDGKVGTFGGSYAATTQLTAAGQRPPALRAMFPSSSYASRYDMVFEGGAFYLLDGLRWNLGQAVDVRRRASNPDPDLGERDGPVGLTDEEEELVLDRWVWHLPLRSMNARELRTHAPGYFQMLEHPSYDAFWETFDISRRHESIAVPALHITGWYDGLLVGTLKNYEGLRANGNQRLIVGPWTHARPSIDSTSIAGVDFGPDAGLDSEALMTRWFRQWLLDEPNGVMDEAPVRLFVMGENRWRDETEWPLSHAESTSFYLRSGGALSESPPGEESPDRFDYDPWDPVLTPTMGGYSRAPMDTVALDERADVVFYTSPPFEAPLEVTGYIGVDLWIASSAPDTDFTGRLLDVAPDGSARALGDGILRLRYRNGFARAELLTPGAPAEIRIELGATSNVFLPGHRIRLEISSSNFPRYDRNPNTGADFGVDAEMVVAHQTIFHDRARPSRLILPVVPRPELETLDWEAELERRISRDRIDAYHRILTTDPHRAGTPGSLAVADAIAGTLADAGLEVEIYEYFPHLSSPRSIEVELVAPTRESLSVTEPPDPRDAASFHPGLEPGFIGYSASGEVSGEVVHVGYGLPNDYDEPRHQRLDVRGKIALARYGRSHRAVKVHTAQERGAIGILIYSDPDDDGAGRGEVWPDGPWRAPHQLQRGNAKYSWFWHGDPLTPGEPALESAARLDPEAAPTLPRIPAVPLSAIEARKILEAGDNARVRMAVEMDDGAREIRNVIATIRGSAEPDRWVIFGTHHDAWTFGGVDPGSAAATILEVATSLASMVRDGWRPARSIVFAFWDAEEYGLVGSTEYAEDQIATLRERVVAYINTDMYNGTRFSAGGTPTLRDFVVELAEDIPGVEFPEAELNALGSGADFVPFQDFVGLPTLSLEFLFEGGWGFGTYHSNYDSRAWMLRHGDDGFRQGAKLAGVLGRTAIRLAEAPVLPYKFSYYGQKMQDYVALANEWAAGRHRFDTLASLAKQVTERATALEAGIETLDLSTAPLGELGELNDRLMRLEQFLVDESEPADRRWYRHVVYGWNIYAMYSGQPFPGLAAAITRGTSEDVEREAQRIERALERLMTGLDDALAVVDR